jgi:chromosome transmission fidelity protein 18
LAGLTEYQFIKSKSTIVTDDAIKSSAVGLKDSGTTLQSTWNSLFIPISAKTRRKQSGIDNGKYVKRLIDTVFSCGDYDKLLMGLFEHYPNLKPLDASLGNLTKLHDWLAYYDRVSGRVNESQVFELMGYLPYAIVPWYSHLAAPANTTKPTEWPKADYEVGNECDLMTRKLTRWL